MGVSEAHALVAFLTAAPDNGGEGWLVGAINNKVRFQQLTRPMLSILFRSKNMGHECQAALSLSALVLRMLTLTLSVAVSTAL